MNTIEDGKVETEGNTYYTRTGTEQKKDKVQLIRRNKRLLTTEAQMSIACDKNARDTTKQTVGGDSLKGQDILMIPYEGL